MFLLMDTMIDMVNLERVRNICGFVNGICMSSNGNLGGMGFWWKDNNVEVCSYSIHNCLICLS